MKRFLAYAFLIALLGLPSYGQQAGSAKCKAASAGCTTPRRASAKPTTVVADAGFGTFMLPPGGHPHRARFKTASLTTNHATRQAAPPVAPAVQEESLGEIARHYRAEKKTHHIVTDDDE